MNGINEIELKYVEERVSIIKALVERFGDEVIEIAAKQKEILETHRIKEKYQSEIPVCMEKYYKYAFNDFENIKDLWHNEILELNDNRLVVKVNKCNYCKMYSKFNARDIGKKLVCNMDATITNALNDKYKVIRPKRMMDGDDYCIFIVEKGNNEIQ